MFVIFMEEKIVTALIFFCMALSIFLRVFLGMIYQNMIKEADNMAATNNKLLKQCKLKFANCYQLSNGVANIPIFVDKFINRLSLGHISFDLMYHLSGQAMLLSVVFSGVGICKCIMQGKTLGAILPFYIVSFLGLYLYLSVSTVVDVKGKRRKLKINLVDYLENHLSPRIDVTRQDIEMLYGEEVFASAPGVTKRLKESDSRRLGKKARKTVELMPISGKLTPEERQELFEVAERFSGSREAASRTGQEMGSIEEGTSQPAVSEEELETLLREFLALS